MRKKLAFCPPNLCHLRFAPPKGLRLAPPLCTDMAKITKFCITAGGQNGHGKLGNLLEKIIHDSWQS